MCLVVVVVVVVVVIVVVVIVVVAALSLCWVFFCDMLSPLPIFLKAADIFSFGWCLTVSL